MMGKPTKNGVEREATVTINETLNGSLHKKGSVAHDDFGNPLGASFNGVAPHASSLKAKSSPLSPYTPAQESAAGLSSQEHAQSIKVRDDRSSERKQGVFRMQFTHTILLVSILAIGAMVGGGMLLYLRAVEALEEGAFELSEQETGQIQEKLRQSFSAPIKAAESFKNWVYHTTDGGMRNQSTRDAMMHSIKYHALSYIESSHILQETGVVLLPKTPTNENAARDPYGSQDMHYSHVWYDIFKNGTREYVHAYYNPGEQQFDTDPEAEFYYRPVCTVAAINFTTGKEIGFSASPPFPPDNYVKLTANFSKFPVNGSVDPEIRAWRTEYTKLQLTLENKKGSTVQYGATETVLNHQWRAPQMWVSGDLNHYAFMAYDTILEPPTDPLHPFFGFGAVQISTYFIFYSWDSIVSAHSDEDTTVVVYDRSKHFVYSPTNAARSASAACDRAKNGTAETHTGTKMDLCSGHVNDPTTPVIYDLFRNDDGIDQFKEVSLNGEAHYVNYKHIYKSVTTHLANDTSEERVETQIDVVVAWARKSAVVRGQITEVISILTIFVVGVFVMFVVLFTAQLVIIGRPMHSLVIATEAMANLDIEVAKHAINETSCDCSLVKVKEVEALTRSFRRTLRFMAEYRTYVPQGLASGRGSDFDSESAGGDDVAPARSDEKALERLQHVGLKSKVGSVLEARFDIKDEDMSERTVRFVGIVLAAVRKHGGIMLRTSPTTCIATWNTHNSCNRHAYQACFCALEIRRKAVICNSNFKISCVVATGRVMAGSVGDSNTKAVAAAGGALELVERVSHLCSYLGVSVLISEDTFDRVRSSIDARAVDKVVIDGIDGSTEGKTYIMYEVKGELRKSEQKNGAVDEKALYNEGWTHFTKGNFKQACKVLEMVHDDRQANRLLVLCRLFENQIDTKPYVRRRRTPWEDFERQLAGNGTGWVTEHTDTQMTASPEHTSPDLDEAVELEQEIRNARGTYDAAAGRESIDYARSVGSVRDTAGSMAPRAHSNIFTTATSAVYESSALPPVFMTTKKQTLYSSGKVLGQGSYGKVYVGMTPDGELVALKCLAVPDDMSLVRELVTEVSVLSKIRHEYIVAYHGSAVLESSIVICMEYMPGGSLSQLMMHFERFSATTVKRYAKDMLKGLEFLHGERILHRDLKPGNVLVCNDGTCKLADFGTCAEFASGNSAERTHIAPMVGTPLYMAPEVVKGHRGYGSDIWSFGVTFVELLMGKVPYDLDTEGLTPIAFVYRVGVEGLRPTVPESLHEENVEAEAIALACFAEDENTRPTCADLLCSQYFTCC